MFEYGIASQHTQYISFGMFRRQWHGIWYSTCNVEPSEVEPAVSVVTGEPGIMAAATPRAMLPTVPCTHSNVAPSDAVKRRPPPLLTPTPTEAATADDSTAAVLTRFTIASSDDGTVLPAANRGPVSPPLFTTEVTTPITAATDVELTRSAEPDSTAAVRCKACSTMDVELCSCETEAQGNVSKQHTET